MNDFLDAIGKIGTTAKDLITAFNPPKQTTKGDGAAPKDGNSTPAWLWPAVGVAVAVLLVVGLVAVFRK